MNSRVMSRKLSTCMICENSHLASICVICVNSRLDAYNVSLKSLKIHRELLYLRLSELLLLKGKADDQLCWRVFHNEKFARLKGKLGLSKELLLQGKSRIEKITCDLKGRYGMLEPAISTLERNRVENLEKFYPNLICTQSVGHMAIMSQCLNNQSVVIKQICKLFPLRQVNIDGCGKDGSSGRYDQICSARLPRGLDPHSIPSSELAAGLGYMLQLLSLVVRNLAAPALYNAGFAGSSSRIWQRDSYCDARPSSRSNEYPLYIPRQKYCSNSGESTWSTNFGVTSIEFEGKPSLDLCGSSSSSSSFRYTSASPHSVETHKELQRGISLVKKSVACVTAFGYNSLCLDVPPEGSTFESFAKMLSLLATPKEFRSALSWKMPYRASSHLNKSASNVDSGVLSGNVMDSVLTIPALRNMYETKKVSSCDVGRNERAIEGGWDFVEHPTFPPPPSQNENVEHWARAMFVDATNK